MNKKSSINLFSFNLTFDDILGITKAVATPADVVVTPAAAAVLDTPAAAPATPTAPATPAVVVTPATPTAPATPAVLDTPAAVVNNSKCKYNIYSNYLTNSNIKDNISDDYVNKNHIFNEQPKESDNQISIKYEVYSDHAPIFYILPDGLQIIVWNITTWGLSNFGSDSSPIYNHKFNMNRLEFFIEYEKRLKNICDALFKLSEKHPNALFFLQECPINKHAENDVKKYITESSIDVTYKDINGINKDVPANIIIKDLTHKVYKQFCALLEQNFFKSTQNDGIENTNLYNENIIIFKKEHQYITDKSLQPSDSELINRNKRISKLLYRIDNVNNTELTAYISIHLPYNNLDSNGTEIIKPVFTAILNQLDELFTKDKDKNITKITVYICGDFNKQYEDGTIKASDGITLIPSIKSEFEDIQKNTQYINYKYKYINKIYNAKEPSSLNDNNGSLNDKCIDYILECIITIE